MTVDQIMSDPRWKPFWFLRPLRTVPTKRARGKVYRWQVVDFEGPWFSRGEFEIISNEPTAVRACAAAIETLNKIEASE